MEPTTKFLLFLFALLVRALACVLASCARGAVGLGHLTLPIQR